MKNKPFIALPTMRGVELIDVNKVIHICAEGKNTLFCLENNKYRTVKMPLGEVEKTLSELCFVRCNQQYMVNIYQIKEILTGCKGLVLTNGEEIKITRTFKTGFKEKLGEYCCKVSNGL